MKIQWSSWNLIEDDFVNKSLQPKQKSEVLEPEEAVLEIMPISPIKPTINTPFGEVAIDNPLRPANLWQCWIAHTDFRITYEIVDLLIKIDGISVIKVLDRYSFCIGIGQMFDSGVVKNKITNLLCPNNSPGEHILNTFQEVKKTIDHSKEWCLYIKDDGSHMLYNGDSEEELLHFTRAFEVMKKTEGGFIFTKDTK